MADDDRFLSRWARRKRRVRQAEQPKADDAPAPAPAAAAPVAAHESGADRTQAVAEAPPDLPDPDTLNETADFTVFLKKEVPEALRRRALRRLWRLNPVFANLDGLNDYDEDYTDAARVVAGLKTLYQAGRGMVLEDDERAPAEGGEAEAAADEKRAVDDDTVREEAAREAETRVDDPASLGAEDSAPASLTHRPATEGAGPDLAAIRPAEAAADAPPRGRRSGRSNALARRWGRFES